MTSPAARIRTQHTALSLALAFEVRVGAAPPEWMMIFDAGEVRTRDDRVFLNDDPHTVVARFQAGRTYLPVDFEHDSEVLHPEGVQRAGWIEDMAVREGAIWARVAWTEDGLEALAKKQFRHISPAFFAEEGTGRLHSFSSLALVLKPAMILPAIASFQPAPVTNDPPLKDTSMDKTVICAALDVAPTSSDETVLTKLQAVTASAKRLEAENASLKAETANLKAETAAAQKAKHDVAVTAALDEAQREGRITPGERDYFKAQCATEDGLKSFQTYASSRDPAISKTPPPGKDLKTERASLATSMRARYQQA